MIDTSKALKPWRKTVAQEATKHFQQPLEGDTTVLIEYVMPRPKAWGKKRQDPMIQRPDMDKLTRAIYDALTDVAFKDDSQVTAGAEYKRRAQHDEQPGVHITVQPGTLPNIPHLIHEERKDNGTQRTNPNN